MKNSAFRARFVMFCLLLLVSENFLFAQEYMRRDEKGILRLTKSPYSIFDADGKALGNIKDVKISMAWWSILGESVEDYKFFWNHNDYYFINDVNELLYKSDLTEYPDLLKRFNYIQPLYFEINIDYNAAGIGIMGVSQLFSRTVTSNGIIVPEAGAKSSISIPGSVSWQQFFNNTDTRYTAAEAKSFARILLESDSLEITKVELWNLEMPEREMLAIYRAYKKRKTGEDIQVKIQTVKRILEQENRLRELSIDIPGNPTEKELNQLMKELNKPELLTPDEEKSIWLEQYKRMGYTLNNIEDFWADSYEKEIRADSNEKEKQIDTHSFDSTRLYYFSAKLGAGLKNKTGNIVIDAIYRDVWEEKFENEYLYILSKTQDYGSRKRGNITIVDSKGKLVFRMNDADTYFDKFLSKKRNGVLLLNSLVPGSEYNTYYVVDFSGKVVREKSRELASCNSKVSINKKLEILRYLTKSEVLNRYHNKNYKSSYCGVGQFLEEHSDTDYFIEEFGIFNKTCSFNAKAMEHTDSEFRVINSETYEVEFVAQCNIESKY